MLPGAGEMLQVVQQVHCETTRTMQVGGFRIWENHSKHGGRSRTEGSSAKRARSRAQLALRERCTVDDAFFVDPESLQLLIVRDVPPDSAAVLRNRACASMPSSVVAGGPRHGRVDAHNLEPNAHPAVVRSRGGLHRRDTQVSAQMLWVRRSCTCRRPQTLPSEIALRVTS